MKNILIALLLAPLLALLSLGLGCSLWLAQNGDAFEVSPEFDSDYLP